MKLERLEAEREGKMVNQVGGKEPGPAQASAKVWQVFEFYSKQKGKALVGFKQGETILDLHLKVTTPAALQRMDRGIQI